MRCKSPLGGFALSVLLFGSSFMALGATHTLTIHTNGAGIVNRNPTNSVYPQGAVVTLTAVASNQWMFTSWSGDASGNQNPINVTMDANKVITANFAPLPQYTLTVATSGQGSVDPPGGTFPSNSVVPLTATASNGWVFNRWAGDVSGIANPISVTINANKSVTAVFVQPPTITSHPQSASVGLGDTVTFSVEATGTPPLSYMWDFNGAPVAGATNTSLTISNVQATSAGNYRAIVNNSFGSATSQVATLTVTNTCSGSNVVTTCNETELRQAMARGGTVRLCCNGTISLTNTIQVTNDVSLDGQNYGVVISGNNAVRLFQVATNVTFELKGLTLANGRHIGTNGADVDPPGQLAQSGEDGAGGAIYNNGGAVRLISCVLSNNSAVGGTNGAGITAPNVRPGEAGAGRGGAIFNYGGRVIVENVLAISNSILGGIRRSTTWVGSNAPSLGGALSSIGGNLSITNSSFVGNVALARLPATGGAGNSPGFARGGAIYTESASLSVNGGTFSGNAAIGESAVFGTSSFIFTAPAYGGALFLQAGTAIVERSSFSANRALGGHGSQTSSPAGGAGAQGGAVFNNGTLLFRDTSVSSNQAIAGGTSSRNQPGSGGGIYNAGTAYVSRTTFDGNVAKGGFGSNGRFSAYNGGDGIGGAIANLGTLYVTNSTLTLNQAQAGGTLFQTFGTPTSGGLVSGGGIHSVGERLQLMNVTVASNIVVQGHHSPSPGGANLANTNGLLSLRNSLVAFGLGFSNEVFTGTYSNASGTITDDGFNISSDGSCNFSSGSSFNFTDPKLDALADNSGPTLTMALLPDSPAIDFGTAIGAPPTDQRGLRRPSGAGVDIGAFEAGAPTSELALAATRNGSMFNISFTAEAGRTYELQRSADLTSWQVHEVISPSGRGTVSRSVSMTGPHSFFRVKAQ